MAQSVVSVSFVSRSDRCGRGGDGRSFDRSLDVAFDGEHFVGLIDGIGRHRDVFGEVSNPVGVVGHRYFGAFTGLDGGGRTNRDCATA